MKLDLLQRLNDARHKRQAVIVVTDLGSGHARLVVESDGYDGDPFAEAMRSRFASGVSGAIAEANLFLTVHLPPPRLVVIGAVHISQALAPMARIAGFDMTVVDPRTAFASADRFPDVALVADWPEDALPRLGLDPFTAVAVLAHDPKIDDPALVAALSAGCFYVGALGSRKSHAKRLERLRVAGVDEASLGRIHAPIGVAVRAQSPAEIAVSILAEVIGALRSRGAADGAAA
jgi:xanthine dehydrogenase accessory factor